MPFLFSIFSKLVINEDLRELTSAWSTGNYHVVYKQKLTKNISRKKIQYSSFWKNTNNILYSE